MKTNQEWVQLYIDEVGSKYASGIEVRQKSESKLLKVLAPVVAVFNKQFMSDYVITIGNTIWIPDGWLEQGDAKSRLQTIAHECLHIKQSSEQTNVMHAFLYLFPQSLAVLSLLAFLAIPFSIYWLCSLLFLLFLAPFPAPFRYLKELEAFRVKIVFFKYAYNRNEEIMQWAKDVIITNLTASNYYFAWPFPQWIQKDLDNDLELEKDQYKEIINFLERHNLTVRQIVS